MKTPKLLSALIALHLAAGITAFADHHQDKEKKQDHKSSSIQEDQTSSDELSRPPEEGKEIEEPAGAQKKESKEALEPKEFLKQAAQGNMKGLKLSQLAAERAQNPSLKQFAQRLIQDHGKAQKELQQLAEKKGIEIASDLDKKHAKHVEHFSQLSGEKFDKEFAKHMVKDHKKGVAHYEKMAQKSSDPEVQTFARNALPMLRIHLEMARQFAPDVEQADREILEPAGAEQGEDKDEDKLNKHEKHEKLGQEKQQKYETEVTPDR